MQGGAQGTARSKAQVQRGPGKPATCVPLPVMLGDKPFGVLLQHSSDFV